MNYSFRNKRLRPLNDEEIRLALQADIPSGSEDERFGSDDSDLDKDYRPVSDDKSDIDIECLEHDTEEIEQVTMTISAKHSRTDESIVESEPVSKRVKIKRKIWQWNKSDLPHSSVPPNKFEKKELEDVNTPLELFLCMIGSETFSKICEESNRFLFQMNKERVKPVTIEELRRFVGILMYMSLVKLPQRRMYWSSQLCQENIANYMTCNRFEEILMIFHLSDNELQPKPRSSNYDRLYKVRVFLSSLQESFF